MAKHLKITVTLSKYTPAAGAQSEIPVPFEAVPLFLLTLTTVLQGYGFLYLKSRFPERH